jgi:hypothetical protein
MAARIAALVAIACLVALVIETWPRPRDLSPSRLERTCSITSKGTHPLFDPPRQTFVPCHLLDEYLQQTWSI